MIWSLTAGFVAGVIFYTVAGILSSRWLEKRGVRRRGLGCTWCGEDRRVSDSWVLCCPECQKRPGLFIQRPDVEDPLRAYTEEIARIREEVQEIKAEYKDDQRLANELCSILVEHVREGEGAVDTLKRLIGKRDDAPPDPDAPIPYKLT